MENLPRNPSQIMHSPSKEFSETFDYVIVFPMKEKNGVKEQSPVARFAMNAMLGAGLEIYPYLSVQDDELLVLFRCPLNVLQKFADQIDFKLQLDPAVLEETLVRGDEEARIAPIKINHDPSITKVTPYEYVFLKYDEDFNQKLYHVQQGEANAFNKSVRLKLIFALLRAPKRQGGCDLELSKLILKKKILCLYPLHERDITDQLLAKCTDTYTAPWQMPIYDIKEYFGEKIGLYYVFIGHYSLWLIIPSLVGLALQLVVWGTLDFSHPVLPFFSVVVTVWAICMLEYWKRLEATTAMRWGMMDFEQEELDRPEFKGELIKSYIDGSDMLYFPESKAQGRLALSQSIITTFIMLVVGVVAAIYVLRFSLQKSDETDPYASVVASVLNTVQITIFNMIYQVIAIRLTDRENHRTDTLYEDSMIVKLFVFQFINSYASFFFLAFIAGNLERSASTDPSFLGQCGATNCMQPLMINLAIIFGTRLTLTNFLDIFLPWMALRSKIKKETAGIAEDKELSPAEKDYMLMNYNGMVQSIQNYADTAIQYGFSMLFVTALPIASLASLFSNYAKLKFQSWKLITFHQRPVPVGVQDIGTWQAIFNIISVVAVVTNAGLICFTMDVLWSISLQGRVWIFIGFQWTLIGIQYLIQAVIDDVPHEVLIQQERIAFINSKVIEKVEDENFGQPDEIIEEEEEEETDAIKSRVNKGCPCLRAKGKSAARKINENCPPVDLQVYPFGKTQANWPAPLVKKDRVAVLNHKKSKMSFHDHNQDHNTSLYAANVQAAVPATAVHAAGAPAGYAAVPSNNYAPLATVEEADPADIDVKIKEDQTSKPTSSVN